MSVFVPEIIIPVLKIAVGTVTLLFIASLICLARGRKDWHGRINTIFFALTMTTVLGLEMIVRFVNPDFSAGFSVEDRQALTIHLCFSIPATTILPFMLYSGKMHRNWHTSLAVLFTALWIGTFITGIFYLPHSFSKP